MKWSLWFAALCLSATPVAAPAAESKVTAGHYLFAWMGDPAGQNEDFLAVIDSDPASATYGAVVASAASGIVSRQIHHTEYWMPQSGMLFANDHMAGKTAIMDVRDPLHPHVHATFGNMAGFSHPHSFLRLPNGHVLASFQTEGMMAMPGMDMSGMDMPDGQPDPGAGAGIGPNIHGGIVEIDEDGHVVRSASTADPARPNDLLMAYSLLPLPDIDRVLVTNSSMRFEDLNARTYQIFRLSDLKRLSTNDLDTAGGSYAEVNPEEARRGPDGSVYVLTLGCGVERVTGIAEDTPRSKVVYRFPGSMCGVPSIVSHYMIETVPILHAVVVIDIAKPDHPVEVSRTTFDPAFSPHWTGYDVKTQRIVITGTGESRLFLLTFDPATGATAIDTAFHDAAGKPGFDLGTRTWPHGLTAAVEAHGAVFSR